MILSEERERQLKADIEMMIQQVEDEVHFCGCCEGDLQNSFPEAKEETARRIICLLKAWNLI